MEACPPLKRGRINTKGSDVKRTLGDVNAVLQFTTPAELTLDSVLASLGKIMASDAGDVSIAKMKADYQAMIDAHAAHGGAGGPGAKSDGGIVLSRKTAVELGGVQGGAALKSVQASRAARVAGSCGLTRSLTSFLPPPQDSTGAFNWVLFKVGGGGPGPSGFGGDMSFVNAGSLSVPEMVRCLPPDEVCLGLLRLGFGTGRFRRTKYVVVDYAGPALGAVKRAKALGAEEKGGTGRVRPGAGAAVLPVQLPPPNHAALLAPPPAAAARAGVKAKLGAFSVEVHASTAEELTLAAVIDKVRRATPVDGSEVHAGGAPEDAYSMDAFLAALAEEAAASAATFGDSGLVIAGGGDAHKSAAATIADIRGGSATNWGAL